MARESSVTLTPKYRKRRYELPQLAPTQDLEASDRVDEDKEADDPVSAQLLSEQQKGAELINNALNQPSVEDPDVLLAQTPAAIINTCSLQGERNPQRPATGPMPRHSSGSTPEKRKRQIPANAPMSPSKRRLPVRGATVIGRNGSGAGKLERPAYIFGDLSKNKAREVREETSDVPKPAVRSLRSAKATASEAPETKEAQNIPVEAANSGSGGRKIRSRAPKVNVADTERKQAGNSPGEQSQQHSTDTKGLARNARPKKSVGGGVVHSEETGIRTTRSGNRHSRNSELQVVIPARNRSQKPDDTLKAKKENKRPRRGVKPSAGAETSEHQKTVQGNNDAGLTRTSQSPVSKEKRLGTRRSETGARKGGETSGANIQSGHDLSEGPDHVDGENSHDESKRASEHDDEVEESITAPSSSARGEIAANSGSAEADGHSEDVDSESDNGAGEESQLSDSADVADDEDDQDSGTVHGRPTAKMPFGLQANWERVMESALSVGQSERNGVVEHKKPRLVTSTIKAILGLSSELKQLLREYGPLYAIRKHLDENSSSRAAVLRTDINRKLKELKTILDGINEADAGNQKKKMIRDIYAHGIPELVFLLNEVFLCYFSTSSIRMPGLMSSLWVHERVLMLCRKAVQWGVQPNTDRPIKRPIRQSIFPVLRDMRTVFQTEQRKMEISALSKKQTLASRRQLEKEQEMERRKHEQHELEKDSFFERQKAALDLDEERIRMLRRKFTSIDVPRSGSSSMPSHEDTANEAATSPDPDTPIERVEIFAPRGEGSFHPKRRNGNVKRSHGLNDTAVSWTDEEREWLMIGLQIYLDADRYERIMEDYGQAGEPLQHRSFDDLVQRAREEKSNVEAQHEVPEWLQSV